MKDFPSAVEFFRIGDQWRIERDLVWISVFDSLPITHSLLSSDLALFHEAHLILMLMDFARLKDL